jgi:hypothetical protein
MKMHIKRKNNSKVHMGRSILSIESKEIPRWTQQVTDAGVLSANFFKCEFVLRDFFAAFRRFWKPLRGSAWDDRDGFICIAALGRTRTL